MRSDVVCSMPQLAVLALVTSWLTACTMVGSEGDRPAVCPPIVEYGQELQARAAEELARLPEGSAIAEMLGDYAVMRDQVRACSD